MEKPTFSAALVSPSISVEYHLRKQTGVALLLAASVLGSLLFYWAEAFCWKDSPFCLKSTNPTNPHLSSEPTEGADDDRPRLARGR